MKTNLFLFLKYLTIIAHLPDFKVPESEEYIYIEITSSPVGIECRPLGTPTPKIKWVHESDIIKHDSFFSSESDPPSNPPKVGCDPTFGGEELSKSFGFVTAVARLIVKPELPLNEVSHEHVIINSTSGALRPT